MTLEFHPDKVWPAITNIVENAGKTYAAIAFIGADAPELLPLGDGDILVVNASDSAVRSRSTNPHALETFIEYGVEVYSSSRLHAKVISTNKHAIIGSANASMSSVGSSEATVVTDDKEIRRQVRKFVQKEIEDRAFEISPEKLTDLKRIFDETPRPKHCIPGVNDPEPLVEGFPWELRNVYLVSSAEADLTDDEREDISEGVTRPQGFNLDVMQVESHQAAFEKGAIVILCDHNARKIHAPQLVDSDAIEVSSDSSRMGQIVQRKVKHQRCYAFSGMPARYEASNDTFGELLSDLEIVESMKLTGERRDALLRIWFPDFNTKTSATN